MTTSLSKARIWVAGHRGMLGAAIVRRLSGDDCEILSCDRSQVDLRDQSQVNNYLSDVRPDIIIVAAAKVGGIHANSTYPADFLVENIQIQTNIIGAAHKHDVDNLILVGSSCVYPREAAHPISESSLLSGTLEPANEWYAVAKISGIKLCEAYFNQYKRNYFCVTPCNLYGAGDRFDPLNSHVVPALLQKAAIAKLTNNEDLIIWGSGKAYREFLYVDDCANGIVHVLNKNLSFQNINIGSGEVISIRDLALQVMKVVGLQARLKFDLTKPEGTSGNPLDSSKIRELGWTPQIKLHEGLDLAYKWALSNNLLKT